VVAKHYGHQSTLARDPFLGENIIWSGRPQRTDTPAFLRALGWAWFTVSAVCATFGVVVAVGLAASPAMLFLCGAWTASLGLACFHGPRLWLSGVEYVITEAHVLVRRGPLRRAIRRDQISYARIFWNPIDPNVGDIELVRAVPAGVLRRRLLVRMSGLAAPDKVLALVRGVRTQSESNAGRRSVTQRLEEGERVLWSARPLPTWRRFLPHGRRAWRCLAFAALLLLCLGHLVPAVASNWSRLLTAGLGENPVAFWGLALGQILVGLLLLAVTAALFDSAVVRPARQLQKTVYVITNRRVLIQRDGEELHLDRKTIVDVIDAPRLPGFRDVFLVLDGPQARALEMGGAFGETDRDTHLKPLFENVVDAESVSRILLGTAPSIPPPAPDLAA
jgi:hypothetical protein